MKKSIFYVFFFLFVVAAFMYYLISSLSYSSNEVVVYVSHDQDYSEPILRDFQQYTGLKVKAVYDTEATKTVGLVNRLIAEKNRPAADVFWNNEVSRTILLKERGVLEPYHSPNAVDKPDMYKDPEGYWTGFAARARVIIYNTLVVREEEAPKSINDLTDPRWRGKVGIANPLAGSTGSHVASLFTVLGDEKAEEYFKKLKANDVKVVESNGMVRDQVAAGDLYIGLTDTDDAYDAILEGKPVAMIYPDQGAGDIGTLLIPNSVMLIKGAPHPDNGRKLIDYLLSCEVEERLSRSKAMQIPLGKNVPHPDHVPSLDSLKKINATQYEIYAKLNKSLGFVSETLLT